MATETIDEKKLPELIQNWALKISPHVLVIYGFGSAFSKTTHSKSDIDLALLCEKPLDNLQRWQLQEELARQLGKNIDLIDLRRATLVMQSQIVGNGQILYCSDENACHAYETYVFSAYCRFQEERRDILNDILKRGTVYGG